MHLKTELLRELSDLFVGDLRASQYYHQLSPEDRTTLENRLAGDAARGSRPVVPGALPEAIQRTQEYAHDELGFDLPTELLGTFPDLNGLSENGGSLYGTDHDLP